MKIILALSALLVVTCASSDSCSEDMIQATKYNKMAENTLRKANRIETWLAMVTKRKQKAANSTMFSYGHAGLKFAVENGINCAGGKYGGSALATLSSCKSSASEKCDSSSMDTNSLSPCMKDAEAIVNAYSSCLTEGSCACFQSIVMPTCRESIEAMEAEVKMFADSCNNV